jgi:hypothetical protein
MLFLLELVLLRKDSGGASGMEPCGRGECRSRGFNPFFGSWSIASTWDECQHIAHTQVSHRFG